MAAEDSTTNNQADAIDISAELLLHALSSSARGAGGGGSRMRTEHLQAIVESGQCARLRSVVNLLANGQVPAELRPYLCGGSITPLEKTKNGTVVGIRPIVVGEALVRLTGRALAISNAHRFRQTMLPLQFGVGVPGGAEQIIHATRLATEAHPEWMSFQADFENAYNCISRHLILTQLHRTGYDDLIPYFLMNYGSPSHLSVRAADGTTHWILSQEGVRQGDPLGPFFFAIVLQSVLEALSEEMKNEKVLDNIVAESGEEIPPEEQASIRRSCWHTPSKRAQIDVSALLDDVRLLGPVYAVRYAARRLQSLASNLRTGLKLKLPKCSAWSRSFQLDHPIMFSGLSGDGKVQTPEDGFMLLGTPIGMSHFEAQECQRTVEASERLYERLADLPCLQVALLLLRYCACPRIQFLLRTVPASNTGEAAWSHDDQVQSTLAALVQEDKLANSQWRQASLRLTLGGLGLGSARRDRIAVYLGSAADCLRDFRTNFETLCDAEEAWLDSTSKIPSARCLRRCMSRLNTILEERQARDPLPQDILERDYPDSAINLGEAKRKLQRRVTSLEADLAWHELFSEMPTRERAQMLSQASPGASAFLSAVPSLPELYLSTTEMRTRLRLPVFKNIPSGPCTCSATSHAPALSSDHLLTCRNEGMLGRRHDNLRRTLRDMATTAGLIAEEEPRGLPGFGQGGGDLLVHDIHPGQAIVADVCVVSEHVDALAETASCRAGHAAKLAENRKRQKYGPACQQLGLGFLPLAIESDGAFGKGLQDFIARCNSIAHGTSIAGTTWAASSFSSYWRQRISVCHRRGTPRAVQRCLLTNCLARSGGTLADFSDFVDPHLF